MYQFIKFSQIGPQGNLHHKIALIPGRFYSAIKRLKKRKENITIKEVTTISKEEADTLRKLWKSA